MRVTVEIVGEGTREVAVDADATYADLLAPFDLSPHEVSVLVDGAPVPEDQPIEADRVRVLRLIRGGTRRAGTVREAGADDFLPAMRVLDGAMLEVDAATVRERIDEGAVLVATADGRVVGALVCDGDHVDAVAVRRTRRGRGIGTALVEAAGERRGRLTADFDPRVRPFYASLGFDIRPRAGRLRAVRRW